MEKIILLVVLTFGHVISDRVYESECPEVTPMQDFDMTKVRYFLYIFLYIRVRRLYLI